MAALLETQKLTKTFIGLKAVTNLDLSAEAKDSY